MDHVAGYTLCNEGTIRDWTRHSKFNVTQGKNFDATGSLGPYFVTADEIDAGKPLHLTTTVNGEVRQDDTTANLIFTFADLIAYVTTFMTFRPGDILVTGTPVGAGGRFDPPRWLKPGDVVEISVPGIGVLRNGIADEFRRVGKGAERAVPTEMRRARCALPALQSILQFRSVPACRNSSTASAEIRLTQVFSTPWNFSKVRFSFCIRRAHDLDQNVVQPGRE